MAKLVFHEEANRQLEAGVRDVVLFVMKDTVGENDDTDYKTGVPWDGVTGITENPSGADITDLYADDIKYASLQAAEKYGFGIEAFRYPPEFAQCDGSASPDDIPGVYLGQQSRKPFAIAWLTRIGDAKHPGMDAGDKLHIVYNSLAQPSRRNYATINENPDAMSMSWDANSTAVALKAPYDSFKPVSKLTFNQIDMKGRKNEANADKWNALIDCIYGSANGTSKLLDPTAMLTLAKTGQ